MESFIAFNNNNNKKRKRYLIRLPPQVCSWFLHGFQIKEVAPIEYGFCNQLAGGFACSDSEKLENIIISGHGDLVVTHKVLYKFV